MNPADISLYGIVDPEHSLGRSLSDLARQSAAAGATLIQYRDKINDTRVMVEQAKSLVSALQDTGIPLIVNDRVDIALASNAAGVHLGQSDMDVADARRILGPSAIIGLSIKTIDEAKACPVEVIDYAFVGGVFVTSSKDNPTAIGLDGWKERAALIREKSPKMPIGAIAGIDETNAAEVMRAGCNGIAVISALYKQDDVAGATRRLRAAIEEGRA